MTESEMKAISGMVAREIGVLMEDVQHKFDIVVEGHQMLSEKVDQVEGTLTKKIDEVSRRIDAVAANLSAHRADTEAHHGVYRVKESGN
jgi:hypothetical protein